MDAERWRKIEQLYHAALECEARDRPAFLEKACAGDEERGSADLVCKSAAFPRARGYFVGQPLRWAQGRLLGGPAPAGRGHGSSLLTAPERGR